MGFDDCVYDALQYLKESIRDNTEECYRQTPELRDWEIDSIYYLLAAIHTPVSRVQASLIWYEARQGDF